MIKIFDLIRFYNEYDFLESRLKFLNNEFKEYNYDITTHAYITNSSNSGQENLIDLNRLKYLSHKYNLKFYIYNIPSNYIKSSSRSAEDFCFYYIDNSIRKDNILENFDIIAWSDLDEIYDRSSIDLALKELNNYQYCYTNMNSCFYNMNYCFNEYWPGTIFFNTNCSLSLGILKYSAHHTLVKNNVIETGIHLSYFKGTEESKKVNSHFINFNNIRLLLAQLGINPQLRYSNYKNIKLPNEKYHEFKKLEFSDRLIFKLVRKLITSHILINYILIFIIKLFSKVNRLLKLIRSKL